MAQAGNRSDEGYNSGVSLSEEPNPKSFRRRKFAHKTRLGCVNCKCVVSGLECSYKTPKAWLFVPKELAQVCSSTSTNSSSTSGQYPHGGFRATPSSHGDEDVSLLLKVPSQTPFESQHEYQAFGSWLCFLMNYAEPRSCFVGSTKEFWLELIPQVVFSSCALRYAMIAAGHMVLSLAKKEVGAPEMDSRRMTLSYANRAMRALSSQSQSILETVFTAWTFWQLEILDGDLKTALLHMHSAIKIVQHAPPGNDSDKIAKSFIEGITSGISAPQERNTGICGSVGKEDSAAERKRKAVLVLMEGFPQLKGCSQRVLASNLPGKTRILAILDEASQEVQWCLKKWLTLDEYVAWRARADKTNHDGSTPTVGLFYDVVRDLNEHLDGARTFVVDDWELSVYRSFLILFLASVSPDLPFRHDMFDFMEFARQIREPRRPTLGKSPCLPFNHDMFSR